MSARAKHRRGGVVRRRSFRRLPASPSSSALGIWQLDRKAWKEDLIATLTTRLAAPPVALPPPGELAAPRSGARRIPPRQVHRHLRSRQGGARLRGRLGLPARRVGPGYWVFAPARLPAGGIVIVDRGFVPEARKDAPRGPPASSRARSRSPASMRWPRRAPLVLAGRRSAAQSLVRARPAGDRRRQRA